MLGLPLIRTLLFSTLFVSTVMGDCIQIGKYDLDPHHPEYWSREYDLAWKPNDSIDAQHASYECDYSDYIKPKYFSKWIWNNDHIPVIHFRTSVLHKKDAGKDKRTDLSISATIINNSYRWKHAFRIRYVLKNRKAYNFWIDSDNSCVAGGFGEAGARAVPFYAGDIDHIELYKYNN